MSSNENKQIEIKSAAEVSAFAKLGTATEDQQIVGDYGPQYLLNEILNLFQDNKINDGKHYFINDLDEDVDIASPKQYLFITPDTSIRIHANFGLQSDTAGTLCLYEAATTSADGTSLTIFNSDRNSVNTSVLTSFYDPTVTVIGTKIKDLVIGQRSESVGAAKADAGAPFLFDQKIILKQDTKYLMTFTPTDDNARISLDVSFFENGD